MRQRSPTGYDRIAPLYDTLARIVFADRIKKAQVYFLKELPKSSRILVLGGGTGWVLPMIQQNHPDSEIWYVDSSFEMLKRAKRRLTTNTRFIHGTPDDLPPITFDAILAGFFFDQFPETLLCQMVEKLKMFSCSTSVWLIADFANERKWWQVILLRSMYLFFGLICGVEAKSLPQWDRIFLECGLESTGTACFYHGFIRSVRYRLAGQ